MGGRFRAWTPEEDATLSELYRLHDSSWEGWEVVLPGRSTQALRIRAQHIGVAAKRAPEWTTVEEDALRRLYPTLGADCADECPELAGRTREAVYKRAKALGLVRGRGRKPEPRTPAPTRPESPRPRPRRCEPRTPEPSGVRAPDGLPVARPTWVTAPVRVLWECPRCGRPNGLLMGGHQLRNALAGTGAWRARCSGCGRESWLVGMTVREERGHGKD